MNNDLDGRRRGDDCANQLDFSGDEMEEGMKVITMKRAIPVRHGGFSAGRRRVSGIRQQSLTLFFVIVPQRQSTDS